MLKSFLLITFIVGLLSAPLTTSAQSSAPQVVVSIKPIHALTAAIMQGVAEPKLLISGGGSPHGYVLRPSEARALAKADLIIWVGHQLESFLEKPLTTLGHQARQLELLEALQPHLLKSRTGGQWEEQAPHASPTGEDEHHAGQTLNPHLWLDPLLAKQIVATLTDSLVATDPAHRAQYRRNAARLQERLDALHAQLSSKLAAVKDIPYIVFHDAYQYFESAYGLRSIGSISIDPERKPGAKRIRQMREKIVQLNARCVFSEPQFEPRLLATIIEGTGARTATLDPLGATLAPGPESYFQLLNNLADDLLHGLR